MSSHTRVLYIGVTNSLERRVHEHKSGSVLGFSSKYRTHSRVYFEETSDILDALDRERSLKGWTRAKKVTLFDSVNPNWQDLSDEWTDERGASGWDPSQSQDDNWGLTGVINVQSLSVTSTDTIRQRVRSPFKCVK